MLGLCPTNYKSFYTISLTFPILLLLTILVPYILEASCIVVYLTFISPSKVLLVHIKIIYSHIYTTSFKSFFLSYQNNGILGIGRALDPYSTRLTLLATAIYKNKSFPPKSLFLYDLSNYKEKR